MSKGGCIWLGIYGRVDWEGLGFEFVFLLGELGVGWIIYWLREIIVVGCLDKYLGRGCEEGSVFFLKL